MSTAKTTSQFPPPAADPTNQSSPVQHVMQSQQTGAPEVDHAKSGRPTPRTDAAWMAWACYKPKDCLVTANFARTLERELDEAREHLKNANRGAERNMHMTRFAHERLEKAEQDRDRLAEALKQIEEWSKNGPTIVRDIANSALAAVKGGDQ